MLRILVIDGETFVREALQRVLAGDAEVSTVATTAEGLESLRCAPADLVIIDVTLPAVDGIAAIRDIRTQYPDTGVIAISGRGATGVSSYRPHAIATNAYLAACTQAGAHGALAKPFETAELRELIQQVGLQTHR